MIIGPYLCTKKREVNVSFDRIKQSHHGVDLSQFFVAFGDLHRKISSFSQKLHMETIDYELLVQMMKNQSISAHQLATTLVNHLNIPLQQLMAPARSHRLESWTCAAQTLPLGPPEAWGGRGLAPADAAARQACFSCWVFVYPTKCYKKSQKE